MGTEVEQATGHIQTTVTTPSAASTSSPKVSMFSRKSGFVIPKNKLSGSLVPVFRGGKKGESDTVNAEGTKPVQRKTKWGPDLTMDTSVRKGRALAYQTRVDQITQQLSLGMLESGDSEDSFSASKFQDRKSITLRHNNEKSEILELERREAIGEILKLNSSFKAPADYKPLLKEANVPIPIKDYPGYNFISLVFGPASDTQKRLEKETGAKIRVYGTRADTGGKIEVTSSDGKETPGAYDELYIHVSADTYEKVDAAVSLIELLVNPVSMNLAPVSETLATASGDNAGKSDPPTEGTPSSYMPPAQLNHGVVTPIPPLMRGHFPQYPQPWFPAGPTQIPLHPRTATVSSAPSQNNIAQISSLSPSNMPSQFGPQPVLAPGFSRVPQNPSFFLSGPQLPHVLQPPYTHQAHPPGQIGIPRNFPTSSLQLTTALPTPTGPSQMVRPIMSPLPQSPLSSSASQGRTMLPMAPSTVPFQRQPVASHPMVVSGAPPVNISATPFAVTSSTPPLPQHGNANSVSGTAPYFETMKPPSLVVPRPQQPNSSDFTFQPRGPQNLASRPGIQPALQIMTPPNETMRAPLTPQSPLIRPIVNNSNRPVQGFPRPQVSHPISQPRPQMPMNFAGSSTSPAVPLRHPTFPSPGAISPSTIPPTPRNFSPANPIVNSVGPFHPRAGNPMHHLQNYQSGATQPQRFMGPPQHFSNNPGRPLFSASGVQQSYDPFSPTSVSFNPHMVGGTAKMQQESDPEYEDLMASVGVK